MLDHIFVSYIQKKTAHNLIDTQCTFNSKRKNQYLQEIPKHHFDPSDIKEKYYYNKQWINLTIKKNVCVSSRT